MSKRKIFSAIPTSSDKNMQTLNIKKTNNILVPQNNSTGELIPEEKKEIILDVKTGFENNYKKLSNKPSINGVELNGNLTSEDLKLKVGSDINIIPEFDIEVDREYNDVYNVPAIHQLLEIFALEMTQMQEAIENKEDKQVYIELNLNYNPSTFEVSIRDWITQNPYEVADEANKKGVPVIAKGYLYYNGNFLETVFLSQTLYSDSSFGRFKYFLGFTDDETMAYLRINKNGTSICGLKKFE
jgi:hypothetical protein